MGFKRLMESFHKHLFISDRVLSHIECLQRSNRPVSNDNFRLQAIFPNIRIVNVQLCYSILLVCFIVWVLLMVAVIREISGKIDDHIL